MVSKKPLTLNEQLALLDDPAPADFDPEALDREFSDAGSNAGDSDSESDNDAVVDKKREHYIPVGKSALRAAKKEGLAPLGPKYEGSRVSRANLYDSDEEESEDEDGGIGIDELQEGDIKIGVASDDDDDIDSDDALCSEDEKFASWKFGGSTTTDGGIVPKKGHNVVVSDDEEVDSNDEEDASVGSEEESENESQSEDDAEDDEEESEEEEEEEDIRQRKTLAKMMAQEKKSVSQNITKAAQSDVDKGAAVRQQQKTFDSFLSARIKLQKALTAINTLPPADLESALPSTEAQESWKAAEASAIKLWNTLHSLRVDITSSRTPNLKKRKADDINETTSIDEIWTKMAKLEKDNTPWREGVLEKWSSKTQAVTTVSVGKKLNNTAPRSLTANIRETLATDRERLVSRTKVPRSCAPVQAQKDIEHDPEIFDDTDLYQQLLKALVDQRMVDSSVGGSVNWTAAMRDSKKKKNVDTKASKGRKMRYHVHEKLQNFMAPLQNNSWQDSQITELFSSLLGQRVVVDEDEDEDMEDIVPDDGLRLFR